MLKFYCLAKGEKHFIKQSPAVTFPKKIDFENIRAKDKSAANQKFPCLFLEWFLSFQQKKIQSLEQPRNVNNMDKFILVFWFS